jgi:hypothetical protein
MLLLGTLASVILGACSSGESGLVLGRPELDTPGGGGSATSIIPKGGTAGSLAADAGAGAVEASAGAGAAGAPTGPSDPPWIQDTCTPTLEFENRDTTAQGQLFTDAVPDPSDIVWPAAHATCRLLYRSASEVRVVSKLSLVVEDYAGIAGTAGNTIHLSTRYLKTEADRGIDLRQEITGILHFATALAYENQNSRTDLGAPGWLIVGVADFVRLEAGYHDLSERTKGGNYDSSSQATAFFLDYLLGKSPSIVVDLNSRFAATAPAWNDDVFVTLLGSDLDSLWAEYQGTL